MLGIDASQLKAPVPGLEKADSFDAENVALKDIDSEIEKREVAKAKRKAAAAVVTTTAEDAV